MLEVDCRSVDGPLRQLCLDSVAHRLKKFVVERLEKKKN